MWVCQLCQKEFNDADIKHEILTDELQRAFAGVAVFETNDDVSYLCDDCFNEYERVLNNAWYTD